MVFDDLFRYTGGFGIYQVGLFIILSLPTFYGGYQGMAMIFLGPEQDHWCKIDRLENFTYEKQKYIAIPDGDHCYYYNLPYGNLSEDDLNNWNWTLNTADIYSSKQKCEQWTFDVSDYHNTAVIKYDLVCDRSYLVSVVYSTIVASFLTSHLIGGPLSDRYGRKKILVAVSFLTGPSGMAAAFAPNYISFLLLRYFMMFSLALSISGGFILMLELVGPEYRCAVGGFFWVLSSVGFITLPGIAVFIKDFQTLQIVLASPMFVSLIFFFLLPESPRWLFSQKRFSETTKVMQNIARVNKRETPKNFRKIIEDAHWDRTSDVKDKPNVKKDQSFLDILRTPLLRRYFLLLLPNWISCCLMYYSLSFNTGVMAGNLYLNTFLTAFVELPAYLIIPCMQRFGCRICNAGSLILAGIACYISVPLVVSGIESLHIAVNVLMFLGKALVSMAFIVVYIYTAELFPTTVRHVSIAYPNLISNALSLLAPFMGKPLMQVWEPLPLLIFGTLGLVSGGLLFLLPQTKATKLTDDISEMLETRKQEGKIYKYVTTDQHEKISYRADLK